MISHNNTSDIINKLRPYTISSDKVCIVIRDNLPCKALEQYCASHHIVYIPNAKPCGFGKNNNDNFQYCSDTLGMQGDDVFAVVNPDITISESTLIQMSEIMSDQDAKICAPNLFKDQSFSILDSSIRYFPSFTNFISSFIFKSSKTIISREKITEPQSIDWASGACMLFNARLYDEIGGFDPSYFLYCEDIDICWRALHLKGEKILYIPSAKAIHSGHRSSRMSINRYLYWHIMSVFRFSFVKLKTRLKFKLYPLNKKNNIGSTALKPAVTDHNQRLLIMVNVDWFFKSHRLPIALAAQKEGFEVHVACAITSVADELRSLGIQVHELNMSRSGTAILGELKLLGEIWRVLKHVSPDVIHTVTMKPVVYGMLLARLRRVPVRIAAMSGLGYLFIDKSLKVKILKFIVSLLLRFSLRNAKAVIFQNSTDASIFKKMGFIQPSQAVLIHGSGVDLDNYAVTPEPKASFVVMFLARFLIDKGLNEFVEAARELKQNNENIDMVLVGSVDPGNPNSVTEADIKAWENEGIISSWGYSKDVPAIIQKSNIMVLPSYREGLPKSLVEAAASGRPVITTDVPGCRDAIVPDSTGLLVPVRNVNALKNAILTLRDRPDLRQLYSVNGRRLAESKFDINNVIAKHIELYSAK